jgi:hypothetical protein
MKHGMSIFGQVLSLIPRGEFERLVRKRKSDRQSKGFESWTQFVSMLFCQLAQAKSLREICQGLKACVGKLPHLGVMEAPNKSTLSYANSHRPWRLYEDVFFDVLGKCQNAAPGKKHKFRFKNKLLSLDATVIDLCAEVFDWAKFRRTKGAIKLHLLLDHDGYLPVFALVTKGNVHDVRAAWMLDLPEGSIVAMDRAYVDYRLFQMWTDGQVWFVTRMKRNCAYRAIKNLPIPANRNVLSDQLIKFTGPRTANQCLSTMRRVVVWNPEKEEEIVLLTNHLSFGATTIADIYKDRWEIELFFKALKQHLKVKTFVGTTPNALRIQIWTALIAMLLIKYLQFKSRLAWSLSNLVALLRWNLFTYRDLWEWIDDPFNPPPVPPEPGQLVFPFLDSISAPNTTTF